MSCVARFDTICTKNVKNTHGGALILTKLRLQPGTKFSRGTKWYQIAQRITYDEYNFVKCWINLDIFKSSRRISHPRFSNLSNRLLLNFQ